MRVHASFAQNASRTTQTAVLFLHFRFSDVWIQTALPVVFRFSFSFFDAVVYPSSHLISPITSVTAFTMAWAQVDEEQEDYFSCGEVSVSSIAEDEIKLPKVIEQQVRDDDSDIDTDVAHTHGPKTTAEKRRAENEVMRAFAANISALTIQEEIEEAATKGAKDEQLSIREILAKQETTVRITNPRDYQTELFQRARDQNIIAVLDTGSGKTHIATLLLKHILDEELDSRAKGGTPKVAFFLVRLRGECL